MLAATQVTAFLATTQGSRAASFYGDTLGLRQISEDPFALVFDLHGVELRIQKVEHLTPQPFTVLGWQVRALPAVIGSLTARGVLFERFPGMTQSADGIWSAPSGAQVAWFRDPDGNLLSVAEYPLSNDR
jgi:catechol 2,3-dioxygenase-like lactoylglutathione lyase family enzyme